MSRNLVTDLQESFPPTEPAEGDPEGHCTAFLSNEYFYLLQFDHGTLIGAVVVHEEYRSSLASLCTGQAHEGVESLPDEVPK
jgi:hypothetical protein